MDDILTYVLLLQCSVAVSLIKNSSLCMAIDAMFLTQGRV